jgi:hypothetical protein
MDKRLLRYVGILLPVRYQDPPPATVRRFASLVPNHHAASRQTQQWCKPPTRGTATTWAFGRQSSAGWPAGESLSCV